MADWIQCPHCQLRHRARETSLCPRCKQDVSAAPDASPWTPPGQVAGAPPAAAAPSDEGLSLAVRAAGVILILNAVANLASTAASGTSQFSGSQFLTSSAIDLVVGGLLISGNSKALVWAKVRAVLGGLGFTAYFLFTGEMFAAVVQGVFSAGLLGLLLGRSSVARMAVASTACGLCLALAGLGVVTQSTGVNPLARAILGDQVEPVPADLAVSGVKFAYRIQVPHSRWCVRKAAQAQKENPLVDRWLLLPERDAHVIVIGEQVDPGLVIDMKAYTTAVLGNAQRIATSFKLVDDSPLLNPALPGRLVHTTATVNRIQIEYYYGLYTRDNLGFQVVGFATAQNFASVQDELRSIVSSFALQ